MGGRYGGNIGHGSTTKPFNAPTLRQIPLSPCACGGHFIHQKTCTNSKPGTKVTLTLDPQPPDN